MQFIYLALAVITSGMSGVFYKKASTACDNKTAAAIVPVLWYLPLAVVFGVAALLTGGIDASLQVILPALLAGVSYAVCGFCLLESMKSNSYSIAIIIVNLSFVFPVIMSMLFLNQQPHIVQLIGMILAIAVIVFINIGVKGGKNSVIALIFAVLSSLGNGTIDFAITLQQHNMPGEGENSFFFFSYVFAAVICVIAYGAMAITGKKTEFEKKDIKTLATGACGIAVCNGVCFFTISLLTNFMNAAAQFTVITALSIMISLLVGCIKMKEKIRPKEAVSLVFCAIAIACQYMNLV